MTGEREIEVDLAGEEKLRKLSDDNQEQGKGFIRVDNYFLDHVMPRVSGAEWKIICAVLRQTTGCQKEEAKIEVSEFQAMTGYERQAVIAAIRNVRLRGIVARRLQQAGGQRGFRFRAVPRANLRTFILLRPLCRSTTRLTRSMR